MKIISGFLGGREIKIAPGVGVRPAMGRTRESLFSMLEARGFVWENSRILDLFAGGGSLGIECVSRGAARAVFVENSKEAADWLAKNIAALGIGDKCRVARADATRFLRGAPGAAFDLVFIDPPYRRDLARPVLAALARGWVAPGGYIVAELEPDLEPEDPLDTDKIADRLFGQTRLHIWKKHENSSLPGNV